MKSILKTTLAGVALLATSSAFADVYLPTSDNGELVLFVKNETTGAVYARGLTTQINSVMTQSAIAGDASYTPGKEISFAPLNVQHDDNLSTFLTGAGGVFSYSVIAADTAYAAGTVNGLGNQRYAFTSTTLDTSSVVANIDLASYRNIDAAMQSLNTILTGGLGSGSSTLANGIWGQTGTTGEGLTDWYQAGPSTGVELGTPSAFYLLASAGGGNFDQSRVYLAGSYSLSTLGDLVFTPNATSEVPLPAAVWLLLSGLGGLGVVGRKKNALAAQAA